jgi:predicted transcriptional regulator
MEPQDANRLLTAKIVGSYLRHNIVGATQLPDLIISVHRALTDVGRLNPPEVLPTPAVSVRQSVRHDYVVCLDCGYRGKTLRRHINTQHGLSGDEYLRRWGLKTDHPLTAPAYSEHRSALAKQLGLGRKPKTEAASAADADGEVESSPKPRRTSRSRPKSGVVNEAASEPKSSRRRPRSRVTQSEPLPTPTANV